MLRLLAREATVASGPATWRVRALPAGNTVRVEPSPHSPTGAPTPTRGRRWRSRARPSCWATSPEQLPGVLAASESPHVTALSAPTSNRAGVVRAAPTARRWRHPHPRPPYRLRGPVKRGRASARFSTTPATSVTTGRWSRSNGTTSGASAGSTSSPAAPQPPWRIVRIGPARPLPDGACPAAVTNPELFLLDARACPLRLRLRCAHLCRSWAALPSCRRWWWPGLGRRRIPLPDPESVRGSRNLWGRSENDRNGDRMKELFLTDRHFVGLCSPSAAPRRRSSPTPPPRDDVDNLLDDYNNAGKEDTGYRQPRRGRGRGGSRGDVAAPPNVIFEAPAELGQYAMTVLRNRGTFYLESLAEDVSSDQRAGVAGRSRLAGLAAECAEPAARSGAHPPPPAGGWSRRLPGTARPMWVVWETASRRPSRINPYAAFSGRGPGLYQPRRPPGLRSHPLVHLGPDREGCRAG